MWLISEEKFNDFMKKYKEKSIKLHQLLADDGWLVCFHACVCVSVWEWVHISVAEANAEEGDWKFIWLRLFYILWLMFRFYRF